MKHGIAIWRPSWILNSIYGVNYSCSSISYKSAFTSPNVLVLRVLYVQNFLMSLRHNDNNKNFFTNSMKWSYQLTSVDLLCRCTPWEVEDKVRIGYKISHPLFNDTARSFGGAWNVINLLLWDYGARHEKNRASIVHSSAAFKKPTEKQFLADNELCSLFLCFVSSSDWKLCMKLKGCFLG